MNLFRRMTWGVSILTLVTLGLAFVTISVVLDRYRIGQFDEDLAHVARGEAEEAPANRFSFSSRPGRPATNDVGPLEKYGVIYDEHGKVMSATVPFESDAPSLAELAAPIETPFDFVFGKYRLRGFVVPIPGFADRRLLLAASREGMDEDRRFERKALFISLSVAVTWAVAAIAWIVRRTTREHERVADVLHRVALGDVQARAAGLVSDEDAQRLGSDIDEIADRLSRIIEHQGRFITHAAHELRSPLSALYGELQQALRRERGVEEYKRALEDALKAARRLRVLADDLLELARARNIPGEAQVVSLQAVLRESIETLLPLAKERDVRIEHVPTEQRVRGTQGDLERIVRNLLDNAIRHSPARGTIQITVTTAGDVVRVVVEDEGEGVREAEREQIFEPFYRSSRSRSEARDGAGLGLAIARELAKKHGGTVAVNDEGFVMSLLSA